MDKKPNKIICPHGLKNQICDVFHVTYPTLRKALDGQKTVLCDKIRQYALNHGAYEVIRTS